MSFKVLYFIILFNLIFVNIKSAKRRFNLDIHNITCQSFGKRFKLVDCHFHKISNDHYAFTENIMLDRDMESDLKFRIWIDVKQRLLPKNIRFIDVKIDACSALTHSFDQQFLRTIIAEYKRTTNLPASCPFKGNTLYKVDNFSIKTDNLPAYAPECNFTFGFDFYDVNTIFSSTRVMGAIVNK